MYFYNILCILFLTKIKSILLYFSTVVYHYMYTVSAKKVSLYIFLL